MRLARSFGVVLLLGAVLAVPARAATGGSIHGGGSASDMTRFALAIQGGTGHFECLMPAVMTVEATVTDIDSISATDASFHGVAAVTLAAHTPFGPPGPMTRDASFTASVTAGGPGTGFVDLEIMGMSFQGTVGHGQISINP
jgi:hypothetical protein